MSWTKRSTSTSTSIDIDEFSEEEMLQGLIDAGWLSECEAETISKRASRSPTIPFEVDAKDRAYLDEARSLIRAGKRNEAVIYVERFLGREWIGMLQ